MSSFCDTSRETIMSRFYRLIKKSPVLLLLFADYHCFKASKKVV